MKYQVRLTRDLRGWYSGVIEIEADSSEEAIKKLKDMKFDELDELADWTHGDEYYGDPSSIEIDEGSIMEEQ